MYRGKLNLAMTKLSLLFFYSLFIFFFYFFFFFFFFAATNNRSAKYRPCKALSPKFAIAAFNALQVFQPQKLEESLQLKKLTLSFQKSNPFLQLPKKVNLSLQTGRLLWQIGVCIHKRAFCSNIILQLQFSNSVSDRQ